MSKLLSTFKIDNKNIEVWEKTNDEICPEDGDAVQKAIIATVIKHVGPLGPDQLDMQLKAIIRMAQGWSNTTMALIPFISQSVKPTQIAEFLGILFRQMVDDEYDYLRKWGEHGPEGTDQAVHGGQANEAEGADSPGNGNGPR